MEWVVTWKIIKKLLSEYRWLHAASNTTIIIHDHFPYDYCQGDISSLNFHLETPDKQCVFSRSGILCGACLASLSQVLEHLTAKSALAL